MATKKQNRRHVVRKVRRALNRGADVGKMSGRRLHVHGYGTGIGRSRGFASYVDNC